MIDTMSLKWLKNGFVGFLQFNGRFKLNFDGSRMENKSASGWVITDFNGTIKMTTSKYICNVSIIIAECITLRDDMLNAKNNGFLNLEIEGDLKIVIDCYNKNSNMPSFIMLLVKYIWKLSQNQYIYDYRHIYRETNRTKNCLVNKDICNLESIIRGQISLMMLKKLVLNIIVTHISIIFIGILFHSLLSLKKKWEEEERTIS